MFSPESYQMIIAFFPRLIGILYVFALAPFLFQIRGLIGDEGILPAKQYLSFFRNRLGKRRFYWLPTLFWLNSSDTALMAVPVTGTVLGILLAFGFSPSILLPPLLICHLSIIAVGQDFLSFGWEMFFCEISYNTFLLTLTETPNPFAWFSMNLLIFRFHFQSGAVKLQSRDPSWKNLTALKYHYETQPIPNAISWYFHKLPMWFHKLSTLMMFVIELVIVFGIFGTDLIRLAAFFCLFFLQISIWISGNYSYLNYLTAALVTLLIGDAYLAPLFGEPQLKQASPFILEVIVAAASILLIILQLLRLWNHFDRDRRIARLLTYFEPFHCACRYGIFAIMTTKRYEIIVEGSQDGIDWKEYLFYYKPSELNRRPRQIAPYQPRLDWQAWFLPFDYYRDEPWFQKFLECLLQGKPHVLALLRHNPFSDHPPRFIRAQCYLYRFSDFETKKQTGNWWVREYVGPFSSTRVFLRKVSS